MRVTLVLTNEDHVEHNIKINLPDLGGYDDEDPASIELPEGFDRDTLTLHCLTCDCVLVVREDFDFEEKEPWQS